MCKYLGVPKVRCAPGTPTCQLKNRKVVSPEPRTPGQGSLPRLACYGVRCSAATATGWGRVFGAWCQSAWCTWVRPTCDGVLSITAMSTKLRKRRSSVVAISPASMKPLYYLQCFSLSHGYPLGGVKGVEITMVSGRYGAPWGGRPVPCPQSKGGFDDRHARACTRDNPR